MKPGDSFIYFECSYLPLVFLPPVVTAAVVVAGAEPLAVGVALLPVAGTGLAAGATVDLSGAGAAGTTATAGAGAGTRATAGAGGGATTGVADTGTGSTATF